MSKMIFDKTFSLEKLTIFIVPDNRELEIYVDQINNTLKANIPL